MNQVMPFGAVTDFTAPWLAAGVRMPTLADSLPPWTGKDAVLGTLSAGRLCHVTVVPSLETSHRKTQAWVTLGPNT